MDKIALLLVIIGALNWGLIGLFGFDLVATLFGGQNALLSRIVYSLVGAAGLYSITFLMGNKIREKS
ncbi:MAG: membrane protein [Peptococcaceae bacterium BICA1-8]|nr:MAG: membrane protein [Peptococcaceae bacterium BICA1-8]